MTAEELARLAVKESEFNRRFVRVMYGRAAEAWEQMSEHGPQGGLCGRSQAIPLAEPGDRD